MSNTVILTSKNTYHANSSSSSSSNTNSYNGTLLAVQSLSLPSAMCDTIDTSTSSSSTSSSHETNETNNTTISTSNSSSSSNTTSPNTNTHYRSYQHPPSDGSVSSAQVGFFLFLLALFACAIFLYLIKSRMNNQSRRSQQPPSNIMPTTTSSDADHEEANHNVLKNMTPKERRHYIDSVLQVKTYEDRQHDIECPLTTNDSTEELAGQIETTLNAEPCSISNIKNDDGGYIERKDCSSDDIETVVEELSINYDDLENDRPLSDDSTSTYDVMNSTIPCCAICLDKFVVGEDISYSKDPMLCQHEYHTTCITEWLMKHPNCPYCRRNYIPLPPIPVVNDSEVPVVATTHALATLEANNVQQPPPTNVTIPQHSAPSTSPLHSSNERINAIYYNPISLTSYWWRQQQSQHQQQLPQPPLENADLEAAQRAITTISI